MRGKTSRSEVIDTLTKLQMIEADTKGIYLVNFEKHQSIDKMAKIKEQTRKRVAAHREKQRLLASNGECNVTVTQCNATDIEEDIEKDKDVDVDVVVKDNRAYAKRKKLCTYTECIQDVYKVDTQVSTDQIKLEQNKVVVVVDDYDSNESADVDNS